MVLFLTLVCVAIVGLLEGLLDGMQVHPNKYEWLFKGNPQFWDTRVSWKNKYKNGDPNQGPKFWGSTKWFIFITDGWHLLQFFLFNFIALALALLTDMNFILALLIYRIIITFSSTLLYK